MNISREKAIFGASILALCIALGMGAYAYMHQDPYKNFITHIDVQADEGVRTLARQRIATAQASIAATEAVGEKVEAATYGAIANDALILGDLVLARESLETALAMNSLNSANWSSYAYVLALMTDNENAKSAYLRAVELTPMEETYRAAIRFIEKTSPEDRDTIKKLYDDSVDTLDRRMFNMLGLGHWYAKGGDCDQAKAHFSVAEDLATTDEIRTQIKDEAGKAISECKAGT